MFCKKLQNLCSAAANPDQMDKNGCDFRTQCPPKTPKSVTNFKFPKNPVYQCYDWNFSQLYFLALVNCCLIMPVSLQ